VFLKKKKNWFPVSILKNATSFFLKPEKPGGFGFD